MSGGLMSGVDLHMQIVEYADNTPPPPPTISVSPASFTRSVVWHNSLPDDTFTVANSGSGLLNYSIGTTASWLSVSPTSGLSVTEADPITIQYDTATLAAGSYQGAITVSAAGASNTPQAVVVNLTVNPPPFAPCDFDQDGDVDQADFGKLQACLSGPQVPQNDPACAAARLDGDSDVDLDDVTLFMNCFSGPNQHANTLCVP